MTEYIFIKRRFTPGKLLPVVLVHGLGNTGRSMIDVTIDRIDRYLKVNTLLVYPNYTPPYQCLAPGLDKELLDELSSLTGDKKTYHQKICIYGFSAGAQFAHRFTYAHPDRVACCAALAAGSWTCPDGTYLDHPLQPGRLLVNPYKDTEAPKVATRKAKAGISKVRWITGCGRQDPRYENSRHFYRSLKAAAPDTRFISFNAGHRPTEHVFKSVFKEFANFA